MTKEHSSSNLNGKPNFVQIVEVSPRDGLQNESKPVPTEVKLQLINRLVEAGVSVIEATSFVSPKWVPQMADHVQVVQGLPKNSPVSFPVLVPNLKGLEAAIQSQVKDIAVFAAATDSFSKKNINCSVEESLVIFHQIIEMAKAHHIRVRGYVSCVLGCPYEGEVPIEKVTYVAQKLYQAGCTQISLGDTIGVGTPEKARNLIKACLEFIPVEALAVHFHDTYGQAIANIYASLLEGIRTVDASVAGLGGCPYAKGASGNVATEDVLYLCQGLNLETGIDLDKMINAGNIICDYLQRPNLSKVAQACSAKGRKPS